MANVRDSDTSLWLHNKLGTSNDSWTGGSITSQLNPEVLKNIKDCFPDLQTQVKLKLLLSFFHIPRRNVDEWSSELEAILEVAQGDSEQWVSMLAEIMKTFPATGSLNTEIGENEENKRIFTDLVNDLRKLVKKHHELGMLPLECHFLNKSALVSVVGQQTQPLKHFTLKRKPKSAALRAELLQKSADAASNLKKNTVPTVPVRSRVMPRKLNDTTPLKGIPSRIPSGGFRSPSLSSPIMSRPQHPRTPAGRKDGGIKLLDINEQPLGYAQAKKRKRMQDMEDAKKASEAAAALQQQSQQQQQQQQQSPTSGTTPSTPDYAVGLTAMNPPTPTPAPATPSYSPATPASQHTVTTIITIPREPGTPASSSASALPQSTETSPAGQSLLANSPNTSTPSYVPQASPTTLQNPSTPQPQAQSLLQSTLSATNVQPAAVAATAVTGVAVQPVAIAATAVPAATITKQVIQIRPAPPITQIRFQPVNAAAGTNNPGQQRKGLSLTREQMLEAQEMFRTANKVTRPEKALILGFMAGSRDNPCPHLGNIVTIKLSESQEKVKQPDDTFQLMTIETHFQMNYNTGEWKRIKKLRRPEDSAVTAALVATATPVSSSVPQPSVQPASATAT
ncbi:negative elongation factor A-like isoform X1 [Schistocerca piceifrons]|uniref:negative elongation factor A-like isoform X1 n=2 Tax=Schistocerca piceifrons TaxID=274613 RepID=UPI001F5F61E5|nr:negative elongation factor A-like isoform X1 [Schistocerca piceifrons]XP_049780357.1 negative elongation factor A-like isoform X1 [Schistocerca cancellata]XP_049862757.1 negative elongation factor A-like isoform X1 [Schistocerca gregaria]